MSLMKCTAIAQISRDVSVDQDVETLLQLARNQHSGGWNFTRNGWLFDVTHGEYKSKWKENPISLTFTSVFKAFDIWNFSRGATSVSYVGSILTVPTFNSYTKCLGSPGIIHNRMPDCHLVSGAWMTLWLNLTLTRKLHLTHGCLTLPMLRLLSSKAQECKVFWKPSKPCHLGIHWIALAEHSNVGTHVPRFQSFFKVFAWFCIGQISQPAA